MTFRLALFFAAWYGSGSVEVVPADCPEGTCEDDSVLMQMGELHKRMSMDEKMAISNIIESLGWSFHSCDMSRLIPQMPPIVETISRSAEIGCF